MLVNSIADTGNYMAIKFETEERYQRTVDWQPVKFTHMWRIYVDPSLLHSNNSECLTFHKYNYSYVTQFSQ